MSGSSTEFVLSAGYGSGGGSYNRGRNDHQSSNDDRGSGGYSRSRNDHQNNDDRGGGGGGYNRNRNDYHSNNDDRGSGGGGYNRGRSDYHDNSGGGGDDNRMETQYDTIFIQNLPRNVTTDELKNVFSQIGMIKVTFSFVDLCD